MFIGNFRDKIIKLITDQKYESILYVDRLLIHDGFTKFLFGENKLYYRMRIPSKNVMLTVIIESTVIVMKLKISEKVVITHHVQLFDDYKQFMTIFSDQYSKFKTDVIEYFEKDNSSSEIDYTFI